MQNNQATKRTLAALSVSLTLFALLFAICLPSLFKPNDFYTPSAVTSSAPPHSTEENGVSYVGQGMTVTSYTEKTSRGDTARIEVSASDGAVIEISAYYASGKSSASVFKPKTVADGKAVWEWKVPESTTASSIRIVLRSEGCYATFRIGLR